MGRPTIQFQDGLQERFARAYPSRTKEASGILSCLRWLEGCLFMLHGRDGRGTIKIGGFKDFQYGSAS